MQIAGIEYLNDVDHFIKERIGIKGYGRYMDDLVLMHRNKAFLEHCLREIAAQMSFVGLEPHPKKTRIVAAQDGIRFLGFDWRVARDGAVVMTLATENVKAMRRRIRRLWRLELAGEKPHGVTNAAYFGWRNHAAKSDSWNVLESNDQWFVELRGNK